MLEIAVNCGRRITAKGFTMTRKELIALSEVSLFKSIDILDLDKFFRDKECRVRHFETGQFPVCQGDSYDSLIILLKGSAGTSMAAPNGKVFRIETLYAPGPVGTAVLFSGQQTLPVTLEALEPLDCAYLKSETVLELMHEFPGFLREYLKDNGNRLLFLAEKLRLFQFRSLRQKIISHLMIQVERQKSDSIQLVYSREEMSQLMGVARPSLSRELSAMVREELISCKGRSVTVLNRKGLMNFMNQG
ncbi:MAG: hypothetical protein B6241_14295 [Spirochaetaceae bacterium 4572_59]|nr:MAG: hypothetical protein B6241_14295 [Spirochaetaceae bacterium 4572_59]